MSVDKIRRSVVDFTDGMMGLEIRVNEELYCTLKSDFKPKSKAEIKQFISFVLGETVIIKTPSDLKPFDLKKGD